MKPAARPDPSPVSTADRLVDATLECLRERGLVATTSRHIAAAAGANLQSITYHFGSKDALIGEAMTRAVRRWLEPALEALRREGDPAARLLGAASALRASFELARDTLPVYVEALGHAGRSTTVHGAVTATRDELRSVLQEQVADLRHRGYLSGWVDPAAMATLLVALLDGLALHAAARPDSVDPDLLLHQVVQLLLAARA
jgi:AcrR family transcriptional regulator